MIDHAGAMAAIKANGDWSRAHELGRQAGREKRPRCLDNGGIHHDQDEATITAMAGGSFARKVALDSAWLAGYDAADNGPQRELGL